MAGFCILHDGDVPHNVTYYWKKSAAVIRRTKFILLKIRAVEIEQFFN